MRTIGFHHGALCPSYESQANEQGYTLGKNAAFFDKVGFGLVAAYIHGYITESEYGRILKRFQHDLAKNVRPLDGEDTNE